MIKNSVPTWCKIDWIEVFRSEGFVSSFWISCSNTFLSKKKLENISSEIKWYQSSPSRSCGQWKLDFPYHSADTVQYHTRWWFRGVKCPEERLLYLTKHEIIAYFKRYEVTSFWATQEASSMGHPFHSTRNSLWAPYYGRNNDGELNWLGLCLPFFLTLRSFRLDDKPSRSKVRRTRVFLNSFPPPLKLRRCKWLDDTCT